ncbi:hypothetical protein [Bacillus massilinigeriensis]|uniref:hypothetical protein n=1 Tax=Bacillus mediterraneensis TaxID=1805474 RepID=UPI00114D47B8|nr:hypothetical protein [Bacillus mediterraneensis]
MQNNKQILSYEFSEINYLYIISDMERLGGDEVGKTNPCYVNAFWSMQKEKGSYESFLFE